MSQKGLKDNVAGRGQSGSTPLGTTAFVGLRALDILLQRTILLSTPLATLCNKLNLSIPPPPPTGGPIDSMTGLTPFQSIIWGMAIASTIKNIYWILYLSNEPMPVSNAVPIAFFNTFFNTANTLLFTLAAVNPSFSTNTIYIGAVMYAAGILTEAYSETQRKWFKDRPENQGKLYTGGLFSLARSINYGGYTLFRAGYALASGGFVWAAVTFSLFTYDFATRGIPVMDEYCSKRYGEQWRKYKERVKSVMFPGIL